VASGSSTTSARGALSGGRRSSTGPVLTAQP
jgi:hypothetical protein